MQREREKALSADKTKHDNIHSKLISSEETSLVVAIHAKRKKLSRLDFVGDKGVVIIWFMIPKL